MVDEKKTILMTKLAIFEKHEKNKSLADEIRFENENCHASRDAAGGRFDGETRYE